VLHPTVDTWRQVASAYGTGVCADVWGADSLLAREIGKIAALPCSFRSLHMEALFAGGTGRLIYHQ